MYDDELCRPCLRPVLDTRLLTCICIDPLPDEKISIDRRIAQAKFFKHYFYIIKNLYNIRETFK